MTGSIKLTVTLVCTPIVHSCRLGSHTGSVGELGGEGEGGREGRREGGREGGWEGGREGERERD